MASKYKINRKFTYEGKIYYIHANSEREAAFKMTKKLAELESGNSIVTGTTTLEEWAIKCIDTYKTSQKDVTRKSFRSRVQTCILNEIGTMQLKHIKPIHCQKVLNLQAGKSKAHINMVYQALNFILDKAVDNNLIASNPAKGIVKPSGTYSPRRTITEKERFHIIKVAKTKRKYFMFLLMLFCGCRPSEAAECMGRDIKVIDGVNMLHIRGTKTKNADRYVPIPDELFDLIKDTPPFDYIAAYRTGSQITYSNRSRVWESFKRDLNISMGCRLYRNKLVPPYPVAEDLVPYCLRHTYCTDLAKLGVDLRIAQKLMGHSSITLTANIYTHMDTSDIASVANTINNLNKGCTHGCTHALDA